jgi:hypothetical protein
MRSALGSYRVFAAAAFGLFFPMVGNAAPTLSPPTLDAPLYACATAVTVQGFVPGAEIDIYVNGTTRVGGGTSDAPWGQSFTVNPPLADGQSVTATQTFGGVTSLPSVKKPVTDGTPTKPVIAAPLYACDGALSVTNLAKGGLLRVYANGNPIGQAAGAGEGQWLSVNPPLVQGAGVNADEKLCAFTGPKSDTVVVDSAPTALPKLSVGEVYDGGHYGIIDGITNGALVTTSDGSAVLDKNYYPGGSQIVRLNPPPHAGDRLTAAQSLCAVTSAPSEPTTVASCADLPAPELSPICPGATSVRIAHAVIDARIQISANGVLVGDGGGPVVNLFRAASLGENYSAMQIVGSCRSPLSSALAVGCEPPQQTQVDIPYGGRAVAIAVDPSNSRNITVASETGGLFRSADQGMNWSQASGSTTFKYTDVTYVPGTPGVIIATADADTRTSSGGGIWHSADGGNTWKRSKLPFPTPDCAANATAYALSVEKEEKRVWAGTLCGLAHSDDASLTWTYLTPRTGYDNDKVLAVLSPDTKRLVILSSAGVKVSRDRAVSFTQSTTGLPGNIAIGVHNQIAFARGNSDHLYWAFNYWAQDGKLHVALYRSTDYGTAWKSVVDTEGGMRPPFVRIADTLSGEAGKYDVYFSNGACSLQRATAETAATAGLSSWTSLTFDHCDPGDLAFDNDNKTPLLLASDGGLHLTRDKGANWTLAGAGKYGYNALQITEVTGQLQTGGAKPHLYFATQDNWIWASPDGGASWTANKCCEGFFLNIPRDYYPPADTKLTGVSCFDCTDFISGPLLANQGAFPDAPNHIFNPRLLKPGFYIQNTADPANPGSTFVLTQDTGGSWSARYFFSEDVRDLSKISGATDDPVVYTPVKKNGATPDGQEIVQLKRIAGVLGGGTPTVSDVSGFGSLGVFATMFEWYKPFGVDPANPNYLILPDIVDQSVKVSNNGGGAWTSDAALASIATLGNDLKFYWAPSTQISSFGFDPDCNGHMLVGTQQAGIVTTYDSGVTWGRIAGSEVIPYVSSFFFTGGGEVIASSYGRGLWKLKYICPARTHSLRTKAAESAGGPVLYWKGAEVPLSRMNPQSCEDCAFFLARGRILDYSLNPQTNELVTAVVDSGEMSGYSSSGGQLQVPFRMTRGRKQGTFSGDQQLAGLLSGGVQAKGLYLDGKVLKGVVLSSRDVEVAQLPKEKPQGPHLSVEAKESGHRFAIGAEPVIIRGMGFDRKYPLEVTLDGKALAQDSPNWDASGTFTLSIPPTVGIGGHTVLVRQKTDNGIVQDATTFLITVRDIEGK